MPRAHDDLTTYRVARSPWIIDMFGYRTEARLRLRMRERLEVRRTWPFLTEHDLQSIQSPRDLIKIVEVRKGISAEAASTLVRDWLVGYRQRMKTAMSSASTTLAPVRPPARPDW